MGTHTGIVHQMSGIHAFVFPVKYACYDIIQLLYDVIIDPLANHVCIAMYFCAPIG